MTLSSIQFIFSQKLKTYKHMKPPDSLPSCDSCVYTEALGVWQHAAPVSPPEAAAWFSCQLTCSTRRFSPEDFMLIMQNTSNDLIRLAGRLTGLDDHKLSIYTPTMIISGSSVHQLLISAVDCVRCIRWNVIFVYNHQDARTPSTIHPLSWAATTNNGFICSGHCTDDVFTTCPSRQHMWANINGGQMKIQPLN